MARDLWRWRPSGGCERSPFLLLWQEGLSCALVNARQVRRFAEAMGHLEKTDRIDAAVIARYGVVARVAPTPMPSAAGQRLGALVRKALPGHRGHAPSTSSAAALHAATRSSDSLDAMLAFLKREARRLEGEIASLIDDDPLWASLDSAFAFDQRRRRAHRRAPGGAVSRDRHDLHKAAAKLAGLAPIANDSGKRAGNRQVRGGRAGPRFHPLRRRRDSRQSHDPNLNAFAQRLQKAGKPKIGPPIALARKLLVILNAKARDARRQSKDAT